MPKLGVQGKSARLAKVARTATDRKPRAERWQELLEAAADIFYEKGYDAASLQDIAHRVGILKGSLYYYIDTKTDLRNSLLLQVHQEGLIAVSEAAAIEGNALDKLAAMIRGHINYICGNLAKTTVYLQELKNLTVEDRTELLGKQSYRDIFYDVIKSGQSEGSILLTLETRLAARAMLGSLNSVYQWYLPKSGRTSAELGNYFVAVMLRGHAASEDLATRAIQASQTNGR